MCPPGYTGDGTECSLIIDPIQNENSFCRKTNVCHPQAECRENTNGIFCTCPAGSIGNGYGPNGCTFTAIEACASNPCPVSYSNFIF